MAKNKFSLDFDGFLEYAKQLDELGSQYLKQATENALIKSTEYVNKEVDNAMKNSPYQFFQGRRSQIGVGGIATPTGGRNRQATGNAKKVAYEVSQKPIEWNGTVATEFAGINWYDAPEVSFLMYGTPHIKADKNLLNAVKCKGKVRKEASRIQQQEFVKALEGAIKK